MKMYVWWEVSLSRIEWSWKNGKAYDAGEIVTDGDSDGAIEVIAVISLYLLKLADIDVVEMVTEAIFIISLLCIIV